MSNLWKNPESLVGMRLLAIGAIIGPYSPPSAHSSGDAASFLVTKDPKKPVTTKDALGKIKVIKQPGDMLLTALADGTPAAQIVPASDAILKYLTRPSMAEHGYSDAEIAQAYAALSPAEKQKLHKMEIQQHLKASATAGLAAYAEGLGIPRSEVEVILGGLDQLEKQRLKGLQDASVPLSVDEKASKSK